MLSRLVLISYIVLCFLFFGPVAKAQIVKSGSTRFSVVKSRSNSADEQYAVIYDNQLKRNRMMKDTLIVRFKKEADINDAYNYAFKNNLKLVEELVENTYLFKLKAGLKSLNKLSTVTTSNGIEELSLVENLDIDEYRILKSDALRRTKLARLQWHLSNDGENGLRAGADINVEGAWEFTRGEGVKVAVIDTGFDLGHSDINFEQGYDAQEDDSEADAPIKSFENHGTAVAGIIAAKDNDNGVIGVAPESSIIPIRLIDDSGRVSVSQIVKAFRKADELGAQIINNSWGSYDPSLADGELLEITDLEKEIYSDLAKNGNEGKGILIIFATGNTGEANFNNAPEARLKDTLSVGATDSTDRRSSYSVHGEELDLVAPGGGYRTILTTDRRDLKVKRGSKTKRKVLGYSKGITTKGFKGTSAAAPVVAGVAALVWSINPNLSVEEVKEILIASADKRMNREYDFDSDGKNNEVGYGRVDAGRAVSYALEY